MRFTCQLSYCDDESHGRGHGSVHIRTCYALPNLCLLHMFIWVGGRVQLSKIDLSILLERFPRVLFSTTVRDLGVTLDQELTLSRHVGSVCRSCFYHLRQI